MSKRTTVGTHAIRIAVASALVAAPLFTVVPAASADPVKPVAGVVSSKQVSDRELTLTVHSESMDRDIPFKVLRPADDSAPRPTLYLLNGAGGGEDAANWFDRTDVVDFFGDKNVNGVVPMEGAFSYYTDWEKDAPELGRNKWTTFLTEELPPVVDGALGTNGVNAIAGISMAGGSVLSLAESAPGLYRSVGAYSGCAQTSTQPGRMYVDLVVEGRGGADTENMWGPKDGPGWAANDPVVNAEKLRGTELYISSGSGVPGPHDRLDGPGIEGDVNTYANQMLLGTTIEAAANQCTHALKGRLDELGIPATYDLEPVGTHAWPYWQDQLHKSWPVLGASIGA
ncbi:alpha/beta hydrolase family protein [Rhodococcus sp. HNM0569]|uniref:alpha/beta hydrolase n=1 Tax=Rhodococcus sp. HNM0569 TaxID=2716340 RepID=UPI00146AA1E9|nr:alpha/beta hydrolase family protein [Rhodococcus sp. HNM0569]NLU83123.1 esterase family protein [Rhodococcus sp. HNM0569]